VELDGSVTVATELARVDGHWLPRDGVGLRGPAGLFLADYLSLLVTPLWLDHRDV
jgi:hypothetical protein